MMARAPQTCTSTKLHTSISVCRTNCQPNVPTGDSGRRGALTLMMFGIAAPFARCGVGHAAETPVRPDDESAATPYMRELLRRSRENKAQYDRDRLEAYYKKNFKDYFEVEAGDDRVGTARGIRPETRAAIKRWLEDHP